MLLQQFMRGTSKSRINLQKPLFISVIQDIYCCRCCCSFESQLESPKMVRHHSMLVCYFCLIWISLSWQRPLKVPRFKGDDKAESVKIETIKDPKAVKQFLVNPKKDSEEFRPVPLPEDFSRYDNNINDNFISLQELIKTTGARRNAKEAFKDADKNGDGRISPEEFQGAPWTLNVSEILVSTNISNINLTEILEEDPKQTENGSLKIGNALDSRETEDKMNSFDIGMENSTDIRLEDSSENRLDDSSESQLEDSFESQLEDSSESQLKDSSESQMEDSFERIFGESSESQIDDSFESRLEDNFESQMKNNFESILEDSSESKLEDSSESKSDDTFESRLEDGLENRLESIFETKLVDGSDIKVGDSSDISVEDNSERLLEESPKNSVKDSSENSEEENPKSREIVDLNSDIQSWNSHHS
ncbi:dentin sialophosphoproteinsialophosphoprotein-like-like [Octopus vulgaris]|uniref:Dentin sialophosphoproteinsialophosphoprotein-like-like n=1 Tax=Octopus vulgaris TaxID=6645 RepID=A0AA36FFJ5_OCTVU|nr:dentin sialophosphoproteinsialophosphoprotein-like-like [Octopus vulgaris]